MTPGIPQRTLTYDERKAAEAAFQGLPSDPRWSQAARSVYEGLVSVLRKDKHETAGAPGEGLTVESMPTSRTEPTVAPDNQEAASPSSLAAASPLPTDTQESGQPRAHPLLGSREDAVNAGLIIDVTPQAQELGLPLPVGMTKALWDLVIVPAQAIPEEEQALRLRDTLMGLRLHLATARPVLPLFEFPVLLAFPPETTPQLCSLLALLHGDRTTPHAVTLVLRNEVSAVLAPFTN